MKTVIFGRKAITFLGITAVLLAAAAFTAGCKTNADDDTGGDNGGTTQNTQRLVSVQTARAYETTLQRHRLTA